MSMDLFGSGPFESIIGGRRNIFPSDAELLNTNRAHWLQNMSQVQLRNWNGTLSLNWRPPEPEPTHAELQAKLADLSARLAAHGR